MLNLYSARACIDKERFLYDNVRGKAYVIVPNQYTLIAEEQALRKLGCACLLDVEIITMNRLGFRLLAEQGKENLPLLDRYGRFMLLGKIVREVKEDLELFQNVAGKRTFLELVNDFIAEFKQQDCQPDDLKELLEKEDEGSLLGKKLSELTIILERYEAEIAGKYTDSEDYIALYVDAIRDAALFEGRSVWIYGFDSVTPKFMDAVCEMAARTDVHFLLNESDFGLEKRMAKALCERCKARGIEVSREKIDLAYAEEKSPAIAYLEKNLFSDSRGAAKEEAAPSGEERDRSLRLVECANPFYEAESAAAYIHGLLRDEGYRMKDIVVICNDEGARQPVIRRTFEEYGLPLFVDARRSISDSPVAAFLLGQLDFLLRGYRTSSLLMMLKTGLTSMARETLERLENYVAKYAIRGNMWKSPFRYGRFEYGDEGFSELEQARSELMAPLNRLEEKLKGVKTIRAFADVFARFLDEDWNLRERLTEQAERQVQQGEAEAAEITAQSYDACLHVLEQTVEILGDEPFDAEEFLSLYRAGLETMEVGLIPPTLDGMTMGTMIRTRPRPVKAVVILGANEGILPLEPSPEGLFSVDEKGFFRENEFPIGALDDLKMLEENAALYRMIAKPTEKIYLSWSLSDGAGEDCRPSMLIDMIRSVLPGLPVCKDVVSEGFGMKVVNDRRETLRHLMNYLKERPARTPAGAAGSGDRLAHALLDWYERHEPAALRAVLAAGRNENEAKPLPRALAKSLFSKDGKDFSFSASRLEKYYRCPFEHFVQYGLNPYEEREFKSSSREIGDLYHECLMRVMKTASDAERNGKCYTEEELFSLLDKELTAIADSYRDGLFRSDGREEYRLERIKEVCFDAVCAMLEQLRQGKVTEVLCEESFGRERRFAPLEYTLDGERIYIEGKIDRIDILNEKDIRIIDYKTGKDELDLEQMRCGYKMQLMVYMKGARGTSYEPAGLFYFNISDQFIALNNMDEKKQQKELEEAEQRRFSLKGVYVDEPHVCEELPSSIVDKPGTKLNRADYEKLERDVNEAIESISGDIISGKVAISPTMVRGKVETKECRYCRYKSICKFDLTYQHNRFRKV